MATAGGRRNYPRCANCLIEIEWRPVAKDGRFYCCVGCAEGGPCSCDYADHDQAISLPGSTQAPGSGQEHEP